MARFNRKKADASSCVFDFNQVARKALRDHPELRKDILLVDVANDLYIAYAHTLAYLSDDGDAYDELQKAIQQAKRLKTSFAQAIMIDRKKTIQAVIFHPDRHPLFDQHDRMIDNIGTIDHELAHILCPDADHVEGENVADAYAVLRHLQRFDGQATDIGYAAWKRTMVFIMSGHTSHLTTFTIDRILADRHTVDFISLTPAQTVALSRNYADKHTRPQTKLSKLARAFKGARAKKISHDVLRDIADITLKADPKSDTFYLGARALMMPLTREAITLDGRSVALKSVEWKKIRARLEKKIATLPPAHPLRHKNRSGI